MTASTTGGIGPDKRWDMLSDNTTNHRYVPELSAFFMRENNPIRVPYMPKYSRQNVVIIQKGTCATG